MIKLIGKASIGLPMAAIMAATVMVSDTAQAQHRSGIHRAQLGNFSQHRIQQRQRPERRGHVEKKRRSDVRKRSKTQRPVVKQHRVGKRRVVKQPRAGKRRVVKQHRVGKRRHVEQRRRIIRDRRHRKARRQVRPARKIDYGHHRRVKKIIVVKPHRRYRRIWVHRRFGHRYHGYGHHHHDHSAYPWLAFTAITLGVLDYMSVSQQRAHESAQITATSAPIGQAIRWNDNGLQGSVTATREGTSSSGRYCREFRQAVTIGGKVDETYGTACRQPDGAWEIMP